MLPLCHIPGKRSKDHASIPAENVKIKFPLYVKIALQFIKQSTGGFFL
jgi:hypothetical protein